jgi:8-oxo-dGTP pyrophosphatase MutT (NUDIX family)
MANRQEVCHNACVMKIVAKVLVFNRNGQLLALKRGLTHPNYPGHLDFPGGEVGLGEIPMDATIREVNEETGLAISSVECKLMFEKMNNGTKHFLYATKLPVAGIPIVLSWEHMQYLWLTPEKLCQEKLPANADAYYVDVIDFLSAK